VVRQSDPVEAALLHGHSFRVNAANFPRRRFLQAAGSAALLGVSRIATAQTYPARPVRIVVPIAAGGGTDILARLIGQWLSEPGQFCRVILDKMQGGPTQFIAESHCAVESWKNFSLKQRAGRRLRDCREEQGCNGAEYQGVGRIGGAGRSQPEPAPAERGDARHRPRAPNISMAAVTTFLTSTPKGPQKSSYPVGERPSTYWRWRSRSTGTRKARW
jgi:hypothetical protein